MTEIFFENHPNRLMRLKQRIRSCSAVAALLLASTGLVVGQASVFQRTLTTSIKEPVILDLTLSRGNVTISYSHEGQVILYASAKDALGNNVPEEYFKTNLLIDQQDNKVTIQDSASLLPIDVAGLFYAIQYKIDVPYRTEVYSTIVDKGNQSLMGVTGPAKLTSAWGDIDVMYLRSWLQVMTGKGNISCSRTTHVQAETGDGNIILTEDGPSKAVVRSGPGKIEVSGARGSFQGSTDRGSLHIKAVLHDHWQLESKSGNIQIHLPAKSAFDLDASTDLGVISIGRDELQQPEPPASHIHQQANGGGKRIVAHSTRGNIFIE